MKGKSHSQTLSDEEVSRCAQVLSENCIIPKLAISKAISSLLDFIKYSGKFPLIFFVTSSGMKRNLCMLEMKSPQLKLLYPKDPLQLKNQSKSGNFPSFSPLNPRKCRKMLLEESKEQRRRDRNFNISTLCSWCMKQEFLMYYMASLDKLEHRLSRKTHRLRRSIILD